MEIEDLVGKTVRSASLVKGEDVRHDIASVYLEFTDGTRIRFAAKYDFRVECFENANAHKAV